MPVSESLIFKFLGLTPFRWPLENLVDSYLLVIVCIIAMIVWIQGAMKYPANLPPGPRGFPIVGYLPQLLLMRRKVEKKKELINKYPKIAGLSVLGKYLVFVRDYDLIKRICERKEVQARPNNFTLADVMLPGTSFPMELGDAWKEQRRFAVQQLRNAGVGKSRFEELILEHFEELTGKINASGGKVKNLSQVLSYAIVSDLFPVLVGPQSSQVVERFNELIHTNFSSGFYKNYPLYLPRWMFRLGALFLRRFFKEVHTIIENSEKMSHIIRESLYECKRSFDPNSSPNNYAEAFLQQMTSNKNDKSLFQEERLLANIFALFVASLETTKAHIEWTILLLAAHPEVQQRAHDEIMHVIGIHRKPTYANHAHMPYCRALIAESLRVRSVAPFSVPRRVCEDLYFEEYFIPKETILFCDLWAPHNDESRWKDPGTFDPTRFLNEDGTKFVKREGLVPFGEGKRGCPGEQMAGIISFLYLVSFIQNFEILPREDAGKVDLIGRMGFITYQPRNMESIWFKKREQTNFIL